jgi:hypothetical protein
MLGISLKKTQGTEVGSRITDGRKLAKSRSLLELADRYMEVYYTIVI